MDFTPLFFVEKDFQQQKIPGMDGFKGGNEWMFGYFLNQFPDINDLVQDPSETTIWNLKSNCFIMDGNGL